MAPSLEARPQFNDDVLWGIDARSVAFTAAIAVLEGAFPRQGLARA
jgi:hypothetical protein